MMVFLSSPTTQILAEYFLPLIEKLKKLGYSDCHSIRGAPYDFRRAPREFFYCDYFFQVIIDEFMYERYDQMKVRSTSKRQKN